MENDFRDGLGAGRMLIGLWQALANPYTAELCAASGFDWLLFDGEHAPNSLPLLLAQLQAVGSYPTHPVVRLPVADATLMKQYLDIGFTTILVPFVETPDQAAAMVAASRYPPQGVRSVAGGIVRASRWGRVDHYLETANDGICVLVQVESRAGIDNLQAIAATPGVDGVFIGPADLAAALGHLGNPGHPDVQTTIDSAIGTIIAAGKAPGILTSDEALVQYYLGLGCTFIAVGTDVGLLTGAARQLASRFVAGKL